MFSTFEKIKELAKKQEKSLGSVEEDLGYGRNTLYKIKNSTPNADRISEIADYFNVSTDYLLGRTDVPQMASNIYMNGASVKAGENVNYFTGSNTIGDITFNSAKDKMDKLHDKVVEGLGVTGLSLTQTEVNMHKLLIEYHRSMTDDVANMRQMIEILVQQNKRLLSIVQAIDNK